MGGLGPDPEDYAGTDPQALSFPEAARRAAERVSTTLEPPDDAPGDERSGPHAFEARQADEWLDGLTDSELALTLPFAASHHTAERASPQEPAIELNEPEPDDTPLWTAPVAATVAHLSRPGQRVPLPGDTHVPRPPGTTMEGERSLASPAAVGTASEEPSRRSALAERRARRMPRRTRVARRTVMTALFLAILGAFAMAVIAATTVIRG